MVKRKTNQELCAEFRALLTDGAKAQLSPEMLDATKPWRNELWRAFRTLEDRMCPTPEIARRYLNGEDT